MEPSKFRKGLFVLAGTVSLGLGCIGIVLPVLPTTPFLLLSAACYYKGSERLHNWILNNRWFGNYIRNYQEGKGIPLKTKIFTLTLLWIVISYSTIFMLNILVVQMILVGIAIGVSIHIVTLPTLH
ncbi:MAG: YbaN family protein [Candidatus Bathyarchaeota archaeon]|nr:YbaN family protein [Candidatus Bathyarchaeota archaeon]